jgi:2-oxoglutarate dehydrogenase E2 component (dihydrolipoamide succinyltransferase)
MLVEVKVPMLSESVAEATLLSWHKKQGEPVKRDENLIDIETDKVVLELPAPVDGVLSSVVKGDGATVTANEVIATIDTDGAAQAPAKAATDRVAQAAKPPPAAKAESVTALPAARKLMADNNISPSLVTGSGRGGRVTKADVLTVMEGRSAASAAPASAAAPAPAARPVAPVPPPPVNVDGILAGRPQQRVPMSRLRARIAERLVQSQSTAAILTTFNEVNMRPVMDLRSKYKDQFEKSRCPARSHLP